MAQKENETKTIPIDQVLQTQFAKIGQMSWEMDMMRQQMVALEEENKDLKDKLKKGK